MTHERGELVEPRRRVETLAIPPQQTPHGEGVTQAMKMRRCDAVGHREVQTDDESMERLGRAAAVHAAPTVEAEQRCVGFGRALDLSVFDLSGEELADARSVRDKAVLAVMRISA